MQWTQTQKIEKGVTIIPLRDESKCDRWVLQSEAEQRIAELEAECDELNSLLQNESGKFMRAQARLDAAEQLLRLAHIELQIAGNSFQKLDLADRILTALEQK